VSSTKKLLWDEVEGDERASSQRLRRGQDIKVLGVYEVYGVPVAPHGKQKVRYHYRLNTPRKYSM